MPDWLTHICAAAPLAKAQKQDDPRYLFAGSIMPDVISTAAYTLFDLGKLPAFCTFKFMHIYLHTFHSPFICLLLAGAASLFTEQPAKVFRMLMLGFLSHFILDFLQKSFYGGSVLLYPLVIRNFSSGLFWYDDKFFRFLLIFSVIIFLIFFKQVFSKRIFIKLQMPSVRHGIVIFFLLAAALLFPVLTWKQAEKNNLNSVKFISNPEAFINKKVALSYSSTVSTKPFIIQEGSAVFNLQAEKFSPRLEQWVSVSGIYRQDTAGNYYIDVNEIKTHNTVIKIFLSLAGALLLVFIWIYNPRHEYPSRK
ncbi:MAG: hypothetical protein A2096_00305 [Spirochaetes bacterium GWF1_41_5]|nr:MAG: hypothetical protein A2096_00305 [Spirochaetes bacterium GWF1_41_5]HBE01217.1 hypothetical protein [Spirochaetia bacterium]